ncbi:MAG TPA: nitroreductase family protein, partial [Candidatus Poseidoniales archaeon]|nr:nitroreductase family protein [Candidatus Poseidoniales archaeon]
MGEGDEEPGFIQLEFEELPADEMLSRARAFYEQMDQRRTTRHFSDQEVSRELIE